MATNDVFLRPDAGDGTNGVRLRPDAADSAGAVTGTIAWTQAGDTWALTGAARVSGTAAIVQADDTWALTGAARVTGTIAFTQEQDTWAATAAVLVTGTISWTQSDDTWAVEGTVADASPVAQPGYDGGSYARQRGLGRFGPPRTQRLRHAVVPEERVFVGKSRAQVLELQLLLLG